MIIKNYEILRKTSNFLNCNSFLLYGENNGLKNDIEKSIRTFLLQKDTNIEFISLFESDIIDKEDNFYDAIYSGSLFSNKKVITIKNGTDKIIKQISDISNKMPENVFLVIFADILEKKSKLRNLFETNTEAVCVACYLDGTKELESIAINELKKNNINLSREALNNLIEKANSDRANLRNEIEKIKSFAIDKKNIEIDAIKSITNFSGEYKSDSFVNECLCGNIFQYKKILSELYLGTINQVFLLRMLSNKVRRLLKMKESEGNYANVESLLSSTRPPIFWKEKPLIKKQLSIWTLNNLKKMIDEINDTELYCKKNPIISKAIFFKFFTKICQKANSYS